jgi:hypothetical protein
MTDKPAPLAFKPAPRPAPRVSADMAAQLADANADLGFTRASSAPDEAAKPAPPEKLAFQPTPRAIPRPAPAAAPLASVRRREARPARVPKPAPTGRDGLTGLKLEIPEDLWTTLRMEAIKRRVTVRFLVLEALAAKGYADLSEFPEDGRRLR